MSFENTPSSLEELEIEQKIEPTEKPQAPEQKSELPQSQLDRVFTLFSPEGAKFSSRSIEHPPDEVAQITLATHGQRIEHLIGDKNTQGILQTVAEEGMSSYMLASKEENRTKGVPVVAYSHFGGGGSTEEGEAKISFYSNGLAGYGEVNWVMPASSVVEKGGIVSLFYDPTKSRPDYSLAGMHGKTGEFGYFTPLGACIEAVHRSERALSELKEMKRLVGTNQDANSVASRVMSSYGRYSDKMGGETNDEYFQRIAGKKASELLQQDISDYIDEQEAKQKKLLKRSLEMAQGNSDNGGVNLQNPLTICFVPKYKEEKLRAIIQQMENLTDREKLFLSNQLVAYEAYEDDDGTIELGERIRSLSGDIKSYAELVLPNIRLSQDNPGLTVDDVVEMLQETEVRIGEDRFGNLGRGGLYAVKKEE